MSLASCTGDWNLTNGPLAAMLEFADPNKVRKLLSGIQSDVETDVDSDCNEDSDSDFSSEGKHSLSLSGSSSLSPALLSQVFSRSAVRTTL